MKLLKKFFYLICILIMMGCGAVVVCALNPSLTQSISAMIPEKEQISAGVQEDEDSHSVEIIPPKQNYVTPSQDEITLPEQVNGLVGYTPITGQEEQITDAAGQALQDKLKTGPTGEEFTFDTAIYPYYGMLDGDMQKLYSQIYANALEKNESFAPAISCRNSQLKTVFEAVYNDHPEIFWLETAYSCKYLQNGQCVEILLKFNKAAEDLAESKRRFEKIAYDILSDAKALSGAEEQEKFIHNKLVAMVQYKTDASMGQSAYSALINGESVCAGYARAFQYLLQQLDIPCYYCTGKSGEDHAWNIVKLGNKYVNVDVTWADTEPLTYDFYNKTDEEFAKTHVRTGLSVKLPACVDVSNNLSVDADNEDSAGNVNSGTVADTVQGTYNTYVNPDPREPLTWPLDPYETETDESIAAAEKKENLKKAGLDEEEVIEDMAEYYADCLKQMVKEGVGKQTFSNVVPESLWSRIEQDYSDGGYQKGYVEEALKKLEKENFAIQLQVDDLSGGYYRLYHNISTW